MKKILTILVILAGYFCSAQTTGYFRYDTVTFQKVGGNSEFNLRNATRGVTGGVLTNMGNGRTAFVTPTGSTNTSLGSGFKIGVNGTNNIKSFTATNGLTADSLTAGQVGIKWGGTLTGSTIIDAGNFNLTYNNMGSLTHNLRTGSFGSFLINQNSEPRLQITSVNTRISGRLALSAGAYTDYNGGFQYIYALDSMLQGVGPDVGTGFPGNYVKMYPDRVIIASEGFQDSYAPDSLVWRTTDRHSSLTLNTTGWHAWEDDGDYWFYNTERITDTTGQDIMVLSRSGEKVRKIPAGILGGGSQGLQSVITNDPVLTGDNIINNDGYYLTIDSSLGFDVNSIGVNGSLYNRIQARETGTNSYTRIYQAYNVADDPYTDIEARNHAGTNISQIHVGDDSITITADEGRINFLALRSGYIDTTLYKPLARKSTGDIVQMNSWAQVSGGGGSGLTVGTTPITSGTASRVLFEGSGNVLQEDAGLTFDPTTNLLTVTGPASSLTNGPKNRFFFDSDANPALDYLMYSHDNLNMAWDSYFDGGASSWKASHSSAFVITKNADRLYIQGNSGLTPGSNYTPTERFGLTAAGIVKMSAYGAGTATFDASGNISSVSDERLKYIKGIVGSGLKEVLQITPVRYSWRKESGMETDHTYAGFSAQNINKALGNEATGINEQGQLSIQDRAIMAAMVNAIKELSAKVDYLEAELKKRK